MLIILGIFGYLLLQVFLGIWLSRGISSETDYVIAGRKLGYTLTTFGIFATWFAAEGIISVTGEVFENGLPLVVEEHLTWAVGILLLGLFVAARLRGMKLITFGDLFRDRFGPVVEKIAILVLIPASLAWAAGQIRAFGVIISGFADISIPVAVTIAAGAVIIYTTFGGMLADAWTDLIQGLFLIIGLIVLFGFVMADGGMSAWPDIPEAHFRLYDDSTSFWGSLQSWMVGIFGSLIASELISRILAAKSPQVARWSTVMGGSLFLLVLMIPITLGFTGTHLVKSLDDPEQLIMMQAEHYLPTVLYVFFAGALVSAILSTVDSTLLAVGSMLAHNLVLPILKTEDRKTRLMVNRLGVVVLGIVAYVAALLGESVHDIVFAAASVGSAGVFAVYLFAFRGKFGGSWAAGTAIVLGTAIPVTGDYLVDFIPYPFLTGFVAAFSAYVLIGWWEWRQEKAAAISEIG